MCSVWLSTSIQPLIVSQLLLNLVPVDSVLLLNLVPVDSVPLLLNLVPVDSVPLLLNLVPVDGVLVLNLVPVDSVLLLNLVPVDGILLHNLLPVDSMSVSLFFFQNLGWWVSATLSSSWWLYCCPDGAPGSVNPINRYGIVASLQH